jgi:hypothetical protein
MVFNYDGFKLTGSSQSYVMTDGRSPAYLRVKPHTGSKTRLLLLSESRGTHGHILLSQIRDSPTWRARSPYLHLPGTGWPVIPPSIGFPFRHLLQLVGIRWWYSNPPPCGVISQKT